MQAARTYDLLHFPIKLNSTSYINNYFSLYDGNNKLLKEKKNVSQKKWLCCSVIVLTKIFKLKDIQLLQFILCLAAIQKPESSKHQVIQLAHILQLASVFL